MPSIIQHRANDPRNANQMVRLVDPDTGDFLHLSGDGRTRNPGQSWLGWRKQSDTLKSRALSKGQNWPFIEVSRNAIVVVLRETQ